METFLFPFHEPRTVYPAGGAFRFGGGYEYGVEQLLPVQRKFTLAFESMRWTKNAAGVYVNSIDPTFNFMALDEFYQRHLMHKRFIYPHELYGNITVRFGQPFEHPKSKKGGSGWTEPFEMHLVEQP